MKYKTFIIMFILLCKLSAGVNDTNSSILDYNHTPFPQKDNFSMPPPDTKCLAEEKLPVPYLNSAICWVNEKLRSFFDNYGDPAEIAIYIMLALALIVYALIKSRH